MCGIVGYCGTGDAKAFLLNALRSLEYRGYDSAGIACIGANSKIDILKRAGSVAQLERTSNGHLSYSNIGIGHTRWATHGEPNNVNAHPHLSFDGKVAIAHNGIIENYLDLRRNLEDRGIRFNSQTDSETIAHLIALRMANGESLFDATRRTAYELEGLSVILAISSAEPETIVGTRVGWAGSLILGTDENRSLSVLASNVAALPDSIRELTHIDHCEAAIVTPGETMVRHIDGSTIAKSIVPRAAGHASAEKGEHPHFMRKEIEEQAEAIQGAMHGRIDFSSQVIRFPELSADLHKIVRSERIVLTGMGSSQFVALSGERWIERLAGIPAHAEPSGELIDRDPILDNRTTVIALTQSGETYDTLSAIELASSRGCRTIALTANPQSQVSNIADITIDIGAGLEVAVAATKTVTASMLTLYLIAVQLGSATGRLNSGRLELIFRDISRLPRLFNATLGLESEIVSLADSKMATVGNALFLGRGDLFPIALEGALKMKEVAYIHAEGLTASEMKHGTNALIDPQTPTIALVPTRRDLRSKMVSSINEVISRGGEVFALAQHDDREIEDLADAFLGLPTAPADLQPFIHLVPLQMLAYQTSIALGHDPDRPRNLAKTVTVA